jgi:hypothetical protein
MAMVSRCPTQLPLRRDGQMRELPLLERLCGIPEAHGDYLGQCNGHLVMRDDDGIVSEISKLKSC